MRMRSVDVHLDTLLYNGHTTSSDALWYICPPPAAASSSPSSSSSSTSSSSSSRIKQVRSASGHSPRNPFAQPRVGSFHGVDRPRYKQTNKQTFTEAPHMK
jgi:hypothetical protein